MKGGGEALREQIASSRLLFKIQEPVFEAFLMEAFLIGFLQLKVLKCVPCSGSILRVDPLSFLSETFKLIIDNHPSQSHRVHK